MYVPIAQSLPPGYLPGGKTQTQLKNLIKSFRWVGTRMCHINREKGLPSSNLPVLLHHPAGSCTTNRNSRNSADLHAHHLSESNSCCCFHTTVTTWRCLYITHTYLLITLSEHRNCLLLWERKPMAMTRRTTGSIKLNLSISAFRKTWKLCFWHDFISREVRCTIIYVGGELTCLEI